MPRGREEPLIPREVPLSRKTLRHKQRQRQRAEQTCCKDSDGGSDLGGLCGNQASQGDLRVQPSSRSQRETLPREAGL